jgi:hypothetical protein
MLKWYGYLGLALIIFVEINFLLVIQPFAMWYIPIVWFGYILFIDSLVYKFKKKSLISNYPKEVVLLLLLSVLFWSIFEVYNLFTLSWSYVHYVWYLHLVDFTTILPAVLETFSLMNVLDVGKRFDTKAKISKLKRKIDYSFYPNVIRLLAVFGAFAAILPVLVPEVGFPFLWIGLFLLLDPLNYLTGRMSVVEEVTKGKKSIVLKLFLAGIMMGFFWEFWNYQAYPKWVYNIPSFVPQVKLFAMPLFGYLGYLPFAVEALLFYAFFRPFAFKDRNDLLSL